MEHCWSKVAGDGLPVGTLQANLPSGAPNITLEYDAIALDQTSLVNDQYYGDTRTSIQGYMKQESAHALYGSVLKTSTKGASELTQFRNSTIIIVVTVGFCFCLGLHRVLKYTLPSLRLPRPISAFFSKYIYLPALVGSLHLQKFPLNLGYVPSRALTLLILAYIALNAAVCAINHPTIIPDTWYILTNKQQTAWLADRLGILSFANIALAIMFSGRNTPLLWITGCSRSEILTFHRWVARIAAIEAIIHVVWYWGGTNKDGNDMFTLASDIRTVRYNSSYWNSGIIAIAALVLMATIFSMLPLRTKAYEIFLFLHIIAGLIVLVGLWYHVVWRYNKLFGYETWLYIAFSFWAFDRVARPFRIVLLNWKSWYLSSHPSAIAELLPGDEFIRITVFPSFKWKVSAGQHCFLYFLNLKTNPFQSHPFSIASWNDGSMSQTHRLNPAAPVSEPPPQTGAQRSSNSSYIPIFELQGLTQNATHQFPQPLPSKPSISFLIRQEHGATKHLHAHLLKSKSSKVRTSVLVEGPYGSAPITKLQSADTILAVAGGIGITSIMGFLQMYLSSFGKKVRPTRFALNWTVREESLIQAVRAQIGDIEELKGRGVDVKIVWTGNGDENRIDVKEVVGKEIESEATKGRSVCVVSCGPGALADGVRKAVVGCVGKKGVRVELVEEAFCW